VGHVSLANLQAPLGRDKVFWVPAVRGASLLAGLLPELPRGAVPTAKLRSANPPAFDLRVKGVDYLGVGQIVRLPPGIPIGALVVAKPESALRSRWVQLAWKLALAFGIGIPLAGALVIYFSRRIVRPLEALTAAADEVAAGHYKVAVPEHMGGSEVERLATRFGEMAARIAESEALTRNFLMSVSHELRTPLTAIRGHVAALREGVLEDEQSRERSLEVVAEEALRLERLVGDVLDLAKLDARRFALLREEVDMRALCERAYATFAEEARARGIEYDLELGEGAVLVTDGDRVLQIVSNLLANALRWTPEGGHVDLGLATQNGEVMVAVADTGPGIEPEGTERIFRPFWSGDGGGTGLGLTIARELALALGGRLELESELGRGSRFVLVLPVETVPEGS
jgi:signal transduction histidine kinase